MEVAGSKEDVNPVRVQSIIKSIPESVRFSVGETRRHCGTFSVPCVDIQMGASQSTWRTHSRKQKDCDTRPRRPRLRQSFPSKRAIRQPVAYAGKSPDALDFDRVAFDRDGAGVRDCSRIRASNRLTSRPSQDWLRPAPKAASDGHSVPAVVQTATRRNGSAPPNAESWLVEQTRRTRESAQE